MHQTVMSQTQIFNKCLNLKTLEPPSGFEHRAPELGIQQLNHYAIAPSSLKGQYRSSRIVCDTIFFF